MYYRPKANFPKPAIFPKTSIATTRFLPNEFLSNFAVLLAAFANHLLRKPTAVLFPTFEPTTAIPHTLRRAEPEHNRNWAIGTVDERGQGMG
jgi:hypothetical protein